MSIEDIKVDINGKELIYRNNPCIRQAGTKLALTKEHVEEFIKCKNDIIYFTETYVKIQDPNKGRSLIKLYPYQKDVLKLYKDNKYVAITQARQSGKSQISAIYIVWYLCFHNDKTTAMLANKRQIAQEIFSRVMESFELLPHFLKPGVKYFSMSKIECDNGSTVFASASSPSAIRGYQISVLFIDECVQANTKIKVRDKETGKIKEMEIEDFYNECS